MYKNSKNAKIKKIFQQEVGTLASKSIHPEITILSYIVKLWAQLGKAKRQNFFWKFFWVIFLPKCLRFCCGWPQFLSLGGQYYDPGHPNGQFNNVAVRNSRMKESVPKMNGRTVTFWRPRSTGQISRGKKS